MTSLAITMGDPCGIGPEITARMFQKNLAAPAFVIGDAGVMARIIKRLGLPVQVHAIASPKEARFEKGAIDVLSLSDLPADLPIGQIDARAGRAAYDYIAMAIDLALKGEIAGMVTAPIHKEALKAAGLSYPGHTEILADHSKSQNYAMMLANDELRVILVTIHVALKDVPSLITRDKVLKTIRLADQACRAYGIAKPRIAVAGLNPHAGEGGLFGTEEQLTILPAIEDARRLGFDVTGPFAGDTIFMRARKGEFDIVVAQYHDQGLIPVKYLGIDHGVNVTVGLPFIRTSVDHGTAFDIAGKGIADPSSLHYAFDQALRMMKAVEQ
jgi:4-hydroxythreonine-4-phosphate dehydrogenase